MESLILRRLDMSQYQLSNYLIHSTLRFLLLTLDILKFQSTVIMLMLQLIIKLLVMNHTILRCQALLDMNKSSQ